MNPTFDEDVAVSVTGATSVEPAKKRQKTVQQEVAAVDRKNENEEDEAEQEEGIETMFSSFQEQEYEVLQTEGCIHERCYPPQGRVASDVIPSDKPAKEYPFELDAFQARSIDCLEHRQSVLVSAHTSAGKTVVAEYAIAMALRDRQRVIYTSPIKALSNQKYRELHEEFEDVGLMTGDVTINPSASCLVMTTEILRNMLYRGSEVIREVAWVIFDEIHYMRDKERGVVWEESMILLHDHVRYVFLSATIPNAREFAMWIAKLHSQPCNVVYTDRRPTPLQHYVFPAGGDGLYLVVDEKSNFRESNFQRALSAMNPAQSNASKDKRAGKKGTSDIYKITKMILERRYDPVIIFSFSKRECEAHALQMSKLDFTNEEEKNLIRQIFSNAIDSLSEEDKRLPQVENILPLLTRGIGIHHGGLLPILKEVIEILFQESLVKVLFSTETFSMGLNMPAKTVVFTSVRKFDGTDFRTVTSGEYIQMSGRAGRRGLDDRGIVILMLEDKMEPTDAKQMLSGKADCLSSSFHLGYNMLLNLLRVEEADPEFVIDRSFYQFQATRAAPGLTQRLKQVEEERENLSIVDEKAVSDYFFAKTQLDVLAGKMRLYRNQPAFALPFLNPGRLVQINEEDCSWGVILNFKKLNSNGKRSSQEAVYNVDVLISCGTAKKPDMKIVTIDLSSIHMFSSVRVYLPKSVKALEARRSVLRSVDEVIARFKKKGLPLLDPVEDMKINDKAFEQLIRKIESLEDRLKKLPIARSDSLETEFAKFQQKRALQLEADRLNSEMKCLSGSVEFRRRLRSMKRVLRRLSLTTSDNVVDVKGRVACEISTGDELLCTELMFSGVFNDLDVPLTVATLSALVYTEKSEISANALEEALGASFASLGTHARRVAEVMKDAKLNVNVDEFVEKFKPDMMGIVYAWCKGASFAEVCKMTKIFEGSVIRCLRRLEELLRQMADAAKLIGNTELQTKFEAGIALIKRDIVFAASLYL